MNAHTFNVQLASDIGLNQAILLQHLYYWHQINEGKEHNIIDDRVWTYNTSKGFAKVFPYLTERQVSYALTKLEETGYVITGNYNKAAFDQTKWYSLEDKALELFVKCKLQNVKSNRQNVKSSKQNVKSNRQNVNAIPDNNTNNNTNSNNIDEAKGKIFFKIVERYPKNRIGNRQHGLKKFKNLDTEQCKLAIKNLDRYLTLAGGYVKSLQNYITEECFSEEWLSEEERNKNKKSNKKDNVAHNAAVFKNRNKGFYD